MSADAERLRARATRERCATIPLPVEWSHPFFRNPLAEAVIALDNLLDALAARDAELADTDARAQNAEAELMVAREELARLHGSRDADYAARDQDMFLALKAELARLRAATIDECAALAATWYEGRECLVVEENAAADIATGLRALLASPAPTGGAWNEETQAMDAMHERDVDRSMERSMTGVDPGPAPTEQDQSHNYRTGGRDGG